MPSQPILFIVCHGKYTEYPLHKARQACSRFRQNQQVHMITHDAEVINPKGEFSGSPLQNHNKQPFHLIRIEYHFSSVGSDCYMIQRTSL